VAFKSVWDVTPANQISGLMNFSVPASDEHEKYRPIILPENVIKRSVCQSFSLQCAYGA